MSIMDALKLLLVLCRETSFTMLDVTSNRSQWWTTTGGKRCTSGCHWWTGVQVSNFHGEGAVVLISHSSCHLSFSSHCNQRGQRSNAERAGQIFIRKRDHEV